MEDYEEIILRVSEILRRHNLIIPELSDKETVELIREAVKVAPEGGS